MKEISKKILNKKIVNNISLIKNKVITNGDIESESVKQCFEYIFYIDYTNKMEVKFFNDLSGLTRGVLNYDYTNAIVNTKTKKYRSFMSYCHVKMFEHFILLTEETENITNVEHKMRITFHRDENDFGIDEFILDKLSLIESKFEEFGVIKRMW